MTTFEEAHTQCENVNAEIADGTNLVSSIVDSICDTAGGATDQLTVVLEQLESSDEIDTDHIAEDLRDGIAMVLEIIADAERARDVLHEALRQIDQLERDLVDVYNLHNIDPPDETPSNDPKKSTTACLDGTVEGAAFAS